MDGVQLRAPSQEGVWKQLLGEGGWQTMDWARKIQSKSQVKKANIYFYNFCASLLLHS